ncbi:MAG TPA: hypothetical protein VIY49_15705 [Bryobacteraceae bacterium]
MRKLGLITMALLALALVLPAFSQTYNAPGTQGAPTTQPRSSQSHPSPRDSTETSQPPEPPVIEPARGTYRLIQNSSAYSLPDLQSRTIKPVHAGYLVRVTGATMDFVQVVLNDGQTAYVPHYSVALFRAAERNYILGFNTPVYSRPYRASETLAEVHQGRNVHVIGVELDYLKIRMRNGTEGYVPVSSVE